MTKRTDLGETSLVSGWYGEVQWNINSAVLHVVDQGTDITEAYLYVYNVHIARQ